MEMVIGLDGHSKKSYYVAQDEIGELLGEDSIPSTFEGLASMVDKLDAPEGTRVAIETGTSSQYLADLCWMLGLEPVVIHAQEVRALSKRKRQKSDRRDAFELCDGLRRGIYTQIVFQPDVRIRRLRRLCSRHRFFTKEASRQIHSVKYQLRMEGLVALGKSLGTETAWNELLAHPEIGDLGKFIRLHMEMWLTAKQALVEVEQELKEAMKPFTKIQKLLCTMPGVGPVVSAHFIATVGSPNRFPRSSELASYLGLIPSSHDSGEVVVHGSITKTGSSPMRALLCEAAHHAGNASHPLNPYFRRHMAKGGYKEAVVAVAHRMARILFQMWKTGRAFDVTKLNVERKRKKRTVVYDYQLKSESMKKRKAQA